MCFPHFTLGIGETKIASFITSFSTLEDASAMLYAITNLEWERKLGVRTSSVEGRNAENYYLLM